MYKRLIEKLKTLRIYAVISRFRAEQKRNDIEMKYKYMFELFDLDWYGYLELQRMKKKELSENGL
jgi:Ca2+-binding EF-hand superfamily protein